MNDKLYLKRFAIIFGFILKIFCLAPYTVNFKNFQITPSKLYIFINLFVLGIYLTFNEKMIEIIYANHDVYYHIDCSMDLILISNNILVIKNYLLVAVAILWAILKVSHRQGSSGEIYNVISMLRIDLFCSVLGKSIPIFVQHQIKVLILFITISYLYYFIPNKNPSLFIALTYLPISEYPKFITNILVSHQHLILIGFKSSLKALNIFFKTQIKYSNNECELSDLVDKIAEIHFRLFEIAKFYNKHFSLLTLMICVDSFSNFVIDAFMVYLYSMMYYRSKVDEKVFKNLIINTLCLGFYSMMRIIQIMILLDAQMRTKREVSYFKLYLVGNFIFFGI